MAVTLKDFLDKDSAVKAARKKLSAASAELNKQKAALATGGARLDAATAEAVRKRIEQAQGAYDEAKANLTDVETRRSAYFETNKKKIRATAREKDVNQAKQELEEVMSLMQTQPNNAILQARAADLNDRINQTGKYAPKPKTPKKDEVIGEQEAAAGPIDYVGLINNAGKYIRNLPGPKIAELSEVLKRANLYNGPIVNIYTDELVQAYQAALASNQARSTLVGEEISWGQFLQEKINEAAVLGLAAGGLAKPSGTVSISTPLEAAAKVEDIFKSELGRLPTAEESAKYSAELIAEERKKGSITKATQKKIGGVIVTEYTGGLDRDQFLQNKIRKLPEFSQRKADARKLTVQDLAKSAMANGFNLMKDFGTVAEGWVKRVENGEDIDIFKNIIRQTAKLGLPEKVGALLDQGVDLDTVYAPYKRIMAATLELNPDSIQLDDPVLRSAIGPEREMTTFDFKRALRKDARWQYTDQAREEVSSAALNVLRDFGFMG